jgi:hypothetical protein
VTRWRYHVPGAPPPPLTISLLLALASAGLWASSYGLADVVSYEVQYGPGAAVTIDREGV